MSLFRPAGRSFFHPVIRACLSIKGLLWTDSRSLDNPITLSLLFLLFLPVPGVTAATIEGVVFFPDGAPATATVYAYSDLDLSPAHLIAKSQAGSNPGHYRMNLNRGRYYLVARGGTADLPLFAFHGANPVFIDHQYYWLPFFLTHKQKVSCSGTNGSGISGRVSFAGKALGRAMVSVYRYADGKTRGMGLLSNSADRDGRFNFDLEPGNYTIVARKRIQARGIGPLRSGDFFCYPGANPIAVPGGGICRIDIDCYIKDDLDQYLARGRDDPRGRKFTQRRGASLAKSFLPPTPDGTANRRQATISGRVTDKTGTPLAAMVVTAYPGRGEDIFQMHILRLKSGSMARTDKNGSYRLRLTRGEKYYLQARRLTGEAPRRGELYGLYNGNANHSVTIGAEGNRSGIDIVAARIMPLPETGIRKQEAINQNDGVQKKTGFERGEKLFLQDQVIRRDTVWAGEVNISGVIVVAPGARLDIAAGTRVSFRRIDRNNDGVGDGEIRVLGTIRATGTKDRPITFVSAAPRAGTMDWSYLLIFASDGTNIIKNCRFSDAFSGIQVHFSTAIIEGNDFFHNNEGLRFGRADISIGKNSFHDNHIGIRFTRMEGPATIRDNLITANDTGIFLVPSGQNITDFFDPDRSGTPWNTGRLKITGNTIAANHDYDLKLGGKQMWDLDARGNRWRLKTGSGNGPRIFDHQRDPESGRVIR